MTPFLIFAVIIRDMLSDTETSQRGTVDKPNYTVFSISGTYGPDRNVDKSTDSVKLSYTIQDQVYTPQQNLLSIFFYQVSVLNQDQFL
jgi:hypothetical protein